MSFLSFLLILNFRKHDLKLCWKENFLPLMHAPVLMSHLVPGGQCSHPIESNGSCSVTIIKANYRKFVIKDDSVEHTWYAITSVTFGIGWTIWLFLALTNLRQEWRILVTIKCLTWKITFDANSLMIHHLTILTSTRIEFRSTANI